ncbi:unnamed protein product [Cylicostephanus goldi]|uniref:Uncharacterized protein n=1 Tax=Cylicostephanus goldi TaxID=71465 RepID=A0A3P6QT02_CYLGO|nr:unnamed protein product [Cylicostephanus goldi]
METTHGSHPLSLPKEHRLDEFLNPDWEATPSAENEYQKLPAVVVRKDDGRMKDEGRLNDLARTSYYGRSSFVAVEEEGEISPPLPSRIESMSYRSPVGRRKTPPMLPVYPTMYTSHLDDRPRLSDNRKSGKQTFSAFLEM